MFHVHLLRLSLLLHLFVLLLFGLGLFLGRSRGGRGSGRRRGRLAHDLLDFVVDFSGLVLNLLGCDHQIFPLGLGALLLVRGNHPSSNLLDEGEAFLAFLRGDVLVLLILNKLCLTSELRRVVLAVKESPRAFTSFTNCSKLSNLLVTCATLALTPLIRSLYTPRLEFCP